MLRFQRISEFPWVDLDLVLLLNESHNVKARVIFRRYIVTISLEIVIMKVSANNHIPPLWANIGSLSSIFSQYGPNKLFQ